MPRRGGDAGARGSIDDDTFARDTTRPGEKSELRRSAPCYTRAPALPVALGHLAARRAKSANRKIAATAAVGGFALAVFANTLRASPLASPPPFAGALPVASPPREMALYRVPTGVTHWSAALAYRGGSVLEPRDFAMTAVLVRRPKGIS